MVSHFEHYLPLFMNLFRYFIMAGIPFLIFYIFFPEKFSKQKIQDKWAKNQDFIREFLHSLKATGVFVAYGYLILNSELGGYSLYYQDLEAYPIWWVPVSILLALMIHDTYFYWMHRIIHNRRLFKWIHVIHHQSTNPTPLASYSFNLLEACLEALVGI